MWAVLVIIAAAIFLPLLVEFWRYEQRMKALGIPPEQW
jgi:hypothetical protein